MREVRNRRCRMLRFSISDNLFQFKSLLTLIARHGENIRFKITKEGINFEGTDRASYSYLFMIFKPGMFSSFETDKEFSAWFDSMQFIKLLKLVDTVPIDCEIDNNYFRLKLTDKGKEKMASLAQIDPGKIEDIPTLNFDSFDLQLRMNIVTLRTLLKDVQNLGGHEIYLTWSGEGLKIETKMELSQANFTVMLKKQADSEVDFSKVGIGSASFRMELLENIAWTELGNITFSIMKTDSPLFIESTSDVFSLRFVIAPFITENADREDSWEKTIPMPGHAAEDHVDGQPTENVVESKGGIDDGKTEWHRQ